MPVVPYVNEYPALTVGLSLFTFILLIVDSAFGGSLRTKMALYPNAPFELNLNALSFYPLFHLNILHWLFNIISLFVPLSIYERKHGTIFTGVTLNLLAVITGLQYCFVGKVLYPNTSVCGLSGIVFSFISYSAYMEHQFTQTLNYRLQGRDISIPVLYLPFISLILCMVLIPGSSFFGHLAGISTGVLLAKGYLKILFPPSKVLLFIESKLSSQISLLDNVVMYYKEEDAASTRAVTYSPLWSSDIEAANINATASRTSTFTGTGHVLGS